MISTVILVAAVFAAATTDRATLNINLFEVVDNYRFDIATWSIIWLVGLIVNKMSSQSSNKNTQKKLVITTTEGIQTVEYKEPGSPTIVVRTPCGLRSALKGSRQIFFDDCEKSGVSFSERIRPPGTSTEKDTQAEELATWKSKCSELKKTTAKHNKNLLHEQQQNTSIQEHRQTLQSDIKEVRNDHDSAVTQANSRKKSCNASKLKERSRESLVKMTIDDITKLSEKLETEKQLLVTLTSSYESLESSIAVLENETAEAEQQLRNSKITILQNNLKSESLTKTGQRLRDQLSRVMRLQNALAKETTDNELAA